MENRRISIQRDSLNITSLADRWVREGDSTHPRTGPARSRRRCTRLLHHRGIDGLVWLVGPCPHRATDTGGRRHAVQFRHSICTQNAL